MKRGQTVYFLYEDKICKGKIVEFTENIIRFVEYNEYTDRRRHYKKGFECRISDKDSTWSYRKNTLIERNKEFAELCQFFYEMVSNNKEELEK